MDVDPEKWKKCTVDLVNLCPCHVYNGFWIRSTVVDLRAEYRVSKFLGSEVVWDKLDFTLKPVHRVSINGASVFLSRVVVK